MKIRIDMKNPDAVDHAIREAVCQSMEEVKEADPDERAYIAEDRIAEAGEKLSKWIEFGEYIHIEFDTEAGTAIVLPV